MDTEQRDRLAHLIRGIDTTVADGRAGLRAFLREIECVAPGVVENAAAEQQLLRLRLTVR